MSGELNEDERKKIAGEVRAALTKYQPKDHQINVREDAILKDDDWYHVLVQTSDDKRDRDFYDALAKAEADLEKSHGGNVHYLLVPVLG